MIQTNTIGVPTKPTAFQNILVHPNTTYPKTTSFPGSLDHIQAQGRGKEKLEIPNHLSLNKRKDFFGDMFEIFAIISYPRTEG